MSGPTVYSELAHLYYVTLGNLGFCDTSGSCPQSGWSVLNNPGPFRKVRPFPYWSGTSYAPDVGLAWSFDFFGGLQGESHKGAHSSVWAVRPGDISPVPIPAAGWLFVSALGLMGLRCKVRKQV